MKYLALVAACLLAVTLGAPAVADDTATPTFTWPTVTSFNPDVYTYEVTVSGEGDYPYLLMSDGGSVHVPGPGTYAFTGFRTLDQVRAYRCVDGVCDEQVAESPALTAARRLWPTWDSDDSRLTIAPGGSRAIGYQLSPVVPGTTLRWYVVPAGGDMSTAVASGEVSGPTARGTVTVPFPADVQDKEKYDVLLRAELVGETYGSLAGDAQPAVATIDGQAPKLRIDQDTDAIYPVADLDDWDPRGHPSHLEYTVFSNEPVTGTYTVTGPGGVVVERRTGVDFGPYQIYEYWYGEGRRHRVYPEGRYEIRYDVVDEAGNPASVSTTVYLSHAKRHVKWRTRTVSAAKTLVDRSVGACSSLTFPSSRRWKGSIGYAAGSRCARVADSNITTLHRLYLPKSFLGSYQLKLYFYGAAATSKPGSAIASGWLSRKGEIEATHVARGSRARWNILPQDNPDVFRDQRGRSYVLWALGTSGANRYDVKSFKYRLRYVTFS